MGETRLIGIGGKARAGKDTLAWYLVDALRARNIDARRYGWADALKAVCRVEWGMRGKDALLLQQVGVGYRNGHRASCSRPLEPTCDSRQPTPDVWITTLLDTIAEDAPQVAIIPDTRFPNEAEVIRVRKGLLIRVTRPSAPETGRDNTHISETALDDYRWHRYVNNNCQLDWLQTEAEYIAAQIERDWQL